MSSSLDDAAHPQPLPLPPPVPTPKPTLQRDDLPSPKLEVLKVLLLWVFVPEDPNPVTLNPEILAEAMAAWAWVSLTLALIIALTITQRSMIARRRPHLHCFDLLSTARYRPSRISKHFQNQTLGEAEEEGCGGVESTR